MLKFLATTLSECGTLRTIKMFVGRIRSITHAKTLIGNVHILDITTTHVHGLYQILPLLQRVCPPDSGVCMVNVHVSTCTIHECEQGNAKMTLFFNITTVHCHITSNYGDIFK